ncbi:microcystin dependent MdpB family protein [Pseudomonas laurentiana]|uniref:phage tail protein n=1 Tax=Pseudomonas laurentiana TaxID=2364649 RepID=UPI0016763FCB|nr:tail fiber protein [Pseudomonas laurentiana]GGU56873.1 microcystin dependent MdpB family protein [Pseudomonas laurentiana]
MADPFLGEIRMVGFNFNPYGWAMCQGQLLPLSQNTALFAVLGTTYGGDGVNTFALPDFRSRIPVGFGQGAGLPAYAMGQQGGAIAMTELASTLAQHAHTVSLTVNGAAALQAVNAPATSSTPLANGYLAIPDDGQGGTFNLYHSGVLPNGQPAPKVNLTAPAVTAAGTGQTSISGQSTPYSLLNPYLSVNFIIALQGIFPSRN